MLRRKGYVGVYEVQAEGLFDQVTDMAGYRLTEFGNEPKALEDMLNRGGSGEFYAELASKGEAGVDDESLTPQREVYLLSGRFTQDVGQTGTETLYRRLTRYNDLDQAKPFVKFGDRVLVELKPEF